MNFSNEIAWYFAWHLDRAKYFGLLLQLLGVFLFLAVWWHGNRGWKVCSWLLAVYFLIIGILRYGLWILYGFASRNVVPVVKFFIIQSGVTGVLLCLIAIIFLIWDIRKKIVDFENFGPEIWAKNKPGFVRWFGLIIAMFSIWSPFSSNPLSIGHTQFTWGFPTLFGVTITPVFLFLAGIFTAGTIRKKRAPILITSACAIISSLSCDPLTVHGIVVILIAVILAILTTGKIRSQ